MLESMIKNTEIYKELKQTCENYNIENSKKEERIRALKKQIKELKKENESLKEKILNGEN